MMEEATTDVAVQSAEALMAKRGMPKSFIEAIRALYVIYPAEVREVITSWEHHVLKFTGGK